MRKRLVFYVLCISSALLNALMVIVDTYGALVTDNIWVYANVSFVVGVILAFATLLVFLVPIKSKRLGVYFDPSFRGFVVPRGRQLKAFILMALGNAISTLGYFYIIDYLLDPSAVLPFIQLVIVYLMIGEFLVDKDVPSIIEAQSLFMVTFGAILASFSPQGTFDPWAFFVVLTVINGGATITILVQRKLRVHRKERLDSINIRFWNLLFTTAFFLVLVYPIDPQSVIYLWDLVGLDLLIIAVVSMEITFFARITYIRALGIGKASVTQAVTSISVIFGTILAIIGNLLAPEIFPPIATESWIGLVKIIGAIMVTLGIISLALSEVKAYILIRASKGPGKEILAKLSKIRGVEMVSAVAGRYDFIVKVKLRALGKGYRLIVRELEKIRGIEDFVWVSTLYEWEEV